MTTPPQPPGTSRCFSLFFPKFTASKAPDLAEILGFWSSGDRNNSKNPALFDPKNSAARKYPQQAKAAEVSFTDGVSKISWNAPIVN
jgi:hypothetical protein